MSDSGEAVTIIGSGTLLPLNLPSPGLFHFDNFEEIMEDSRKRNERTDILNEHVHPPTNLRLDRSEQREAAVSPRVEQYHNNLQGHDKITPCTIDAPKTAHSLSKRSRGQSSTPKKVTLIKSPNNGEKVVAVGSEPLMYENVLLGKQLPILPNAPDTQIQHRESIWERIKQFVRKVTGIGDLGARILT
ncbi:uncharacterized protein LAJ45_05650 [Morchella importuna]|uniref:Uncharacterized protein n=1 Tax=Morchella conica CCBAS932 TaxID=1392247 RepID=A0A3N4KTY4_9PEZI|nr:uncharacterized protein LAJ45_05650 [Morchella importuna]KAH8150437.1 hypothetical protein LAJ45_05650 [Morchella importuna]RPB14044.1 hypothetical protein P167DRAFT_572966 [Morchella conica CCBAS932]